MLMLLLVHLHDHIGLNFVQSSSVEQADFVSVRRSSDQVD